MSITAMLCSVMNTYLLCAQGTLYHCRRLISNFLFSLWSGCRVAVTRMENMDFCKRMMIPRTNQVMFGANPSCFVRPVDFGTGPHTLGQICQFIWNLPGTGTHHLPMHANRDTGCGEKEHTMQSKQCEQEKLSRNTNWRLFAQICAEERWDLREVLVESGASSFSRAKIVRPRHSQPLRVKHTGQR